jgi:hypothetical protein
MFRGRHENINSWFSHPGKLNQTSLEALKCDLEVLMYHHAALYGNFVRLSVDHVTKLACWVTSRVSTNLYTTRASKLHTIAWYSLSGNFYVACVEVVVDASQSIMSLIIRWAEVGCTISRVASEITHCIESAILSITKEWERTHFHTSAWMIAIIPDQRAFQSGRRTYKNRSQKVLEHFLRE